MCDATTTYEVTLTSVSPEWITQNYDYYEDYDNNDDTGTQVPQSETEWVDARTRNRRDLSNNFNADKTLNYTVCVRLVCALHIAFPLYE